MNRAEERWRKIPDWPAYEVSDQGRIRRISTGRIIQGAENPFGYRVFFPQRGKTVFVHRAVLRAFAGAPPEGHETRHLDGDKKNNRIENLRWGTRSENQQDNFRHGVRVRGENHPQSKLRTADVAEILTSPDSTRELAQRFGVSQTHISTIKRGLRRVGT